ncbi:hypothetical protein [Terrimonas ferruginea]|uniref:hypothetical protein n=1 Tax=Terrimonas ferruginea TaxID=249 RepID=UPI00048E80F2|nr:hypothetical protein [Terrimonas ferruginea]
MARKVVLGYTDKLQFLGNEECRTRYMAAEGTNPARLEYDYMIKDHLGNVRVLITEEQNQTPIRLPRWKRLKRL